MSKIDPQRATVFIVVFAVLAIFINSMGKRGFRQQAPAFVTPVAQQPQMEPAQGQVEKPTAERKATEEHAAYLARYVNAGATRTPGVKTLAIVAVSESGKLDQAVNTALAQHFKTGTVETASSFFTPEFVSDGLITEVFNGSTSVFKNLELARSLDGVLLARQTVQYAKDASMENLVSANMQLEVMLSAVGSQGQSQSWTFTAFGSGFDQKAARAMAEERLIKQIAKDTQMSY